MKLTRIKTSTILAFVTKKVKDDAKRTTQQDTTYFEGRLADAAKDGKDEEYLAKSLPRKMEKQYRAGKLTRTQAIKLVKADIAERIKADCDNTLAFINRGFKAPLPSRISIETNWKRNPTWGFNPHTDVWAGGMHTEGKASGCGYDKESAATAQAFNENPIFARIVATCAYLDEKESTKERKVQTYGYRLDVYGARFEGAVGYNCHDSIIQRAGYKCISSVHPKSADVYEYELKEATIETPEVKNA